MAISITLILLAGIAGLITGYIAGRSRWRLAMRLSVGVLLIAIALLVLVAATVTTLLQQKELAEQLAIVTYYILILLVIFNIINFIRQDPEEG